MPLPPTELRIGLVLNGGVSLAVWIGGVVHELDELRRAVPSPEAGYPDALLERHTGARIDVIAGASAGGINGALLAAAIQGTTAAGARALRGADGGSLRDVWLQLGDLRRMTRSAREVDPPSLLRGDDYLLPNLKEHLDALLVDESESALDHPLYLYMSATDLRGTGTARFQTSDDVIHERDHRVVFKFSANPEPGLGDDAGDPPEGDLMRETLRLERANSKRLARAARSSSSFPGAFAPHRVTLERNEEKVTTFLVDGGILDNQPIRPLLDRIRLMTIDLPVRRVVLFVVPYVTKEQVKEKDNERRESADSPPGLIEVVRSGGLARDLPKLESLQRAEEELSAGRAAYVVNEALFKDLPALVPAAGSLFATYREVQRSELLQTVDQWDATSETGTGPLGGSERAGVEQEVTARQREMTDRITALLEADLPSPDWNVATSTWQGVNWTWGLSKAERFARTALSWLELDGNDNAPTTAARQAASALGIAARRAMEARRAAFYRLRETIDDPVEAFALSSHEIASERNDVQEAVATLGAVLARALGLGEAQVIRDFLMTVEVCTNVAGTRPSPPPLFDFYRVSAEGDVLGHPSCTPDKKLAGMQLGHFAAFLKRSWRANDWMWGRLDAARHIGALIFAAPGMTAQRDDWIRARQMTILREELPGVASEIVNDEKAGFSEICAFSLWQRAHADTLASISEGTASDESVVAAFRQLELGDDLVGAETGARATVATATGLAAVASRALSGDQSGLPGPVRALVGLTRRTASVTNTLARTFSRWPAAGFAVILLVGVIAAVLAASNGIAAAWLVPALVAIAVGGAWTGYGWLSSPPRPWRAAVLTLAVLSLVVGNIQVNAPGGLDEAGNWFDPPNGAGDAVWWLTVAVGVVTVAMVVAYDGSTALTQSLARRLKGWIGVGLVSLLALLLGRVAWDRVADTNKNRKDSGWEGWFESNTAVRAFLIASVVLVVLVQVIDLLQWRIKPRDESD